MRREVKDVLDAYYGVERIIDEMPVATALGLMRNVAEKLANTIESIA